MHKHRFITVAVSVTLCAQLLVGCAFAGQNGPTANATSNTALRTTPSASISTASHSPTDPKQMVNAIWRAAKRGRISGIPFQIGQTIDLVNNAWGKATQETAAGAGIYETYTRRNAAFGFNKGGQIFDVRQFAGRLRSIRLSDVNATLGAPGAIRSMPGQTIRLYTAGPDYHLLWVFPKPTAKEPNPRLDHVSVFCPQYTVNSMAQNEPNPSIVINQSPGSVGHLFTFSIEQPPSGFTLTQFVWTATNGDYVVTTLGEALRFGATGGSRAHFEVSGDGQTLSFIYGSSEIHQMGRVKLVYQNTQGTAIIGESAPFTLK